MKVRYQNGNVSSVRNDLGRELIRAGMATLVEDDPPDTTVRPAFERPYRMPQFSDWKPPAPPRFQVTRVKISGPPSDVRGAGTQEELVIRCDYNNSVLFYSGKPEFVNAKRTWDGGWSFLAGWPAAVPDNVVAEYTKIYNKHEHLRGPLPEKEHPSATVPLPKGVFE